MLPYRPAPRLRPATRSNAPTAAAHVLVGSMVAPFPYDSPIRPPGTLTRPLVAFLARRRVPMLDRLRVVSCRIAERYRDWVDGFAKVRARPT